MNDRPLADTAALLGRALLSAIFISSGYDKLMAMSRTVAYFVKDGVPVPEAAWVVAVFVELVVGLALLFGFQARLAGLILAAWCIVTALVGHIDFSVAGNEINFMKNVAIAGGMLMVAAFGPGRYSLDALRTRRAVIA